MTVSDGSLAIVSAGMLTTLLFLLSYLAALFFLAQYCGFWVYPQIKGMSTLMRTFWIALLSSFGLLLNLLGEYFTHLVWSCHVNGNHRVPCMENNETQNQPTHKPALSWYQIICRHPNTSDYSCVYSQLRVKQE